MARRLTQVLIVVGLLCEIPDVHARQQDPINPPHVAVALCDKVGLEPATLLQAKTATLKILNAAGVQATWTESRSSATTTFNPNSYEDCEISSNESILVIITSDEPEGQSPDTMGLAPRTDVYRRRAYILYNRVKRFVQDHRPRSDLQSEMGYVLGNVIVHELGHLLMPGKGHSPAGLMSKNWGYHEAQDAVSGRLFFAGAQSALIRRQLATNESKFRLSQSFIPGQ